MEWFSAWAEAFGPGLLAPNAGQALPLVWRSCGAGGVPIRCLRGPANEHTPWLQLPDGLERALPSWPQELLRAYDADMLLLPLLRRDSQNLSVLPPGPLTRWQPGGRAPFVDCSGSWEQYWSGRGRKTRSEWARAERRLQEQGYRLGCHRGEEGLEEVLGEAFAIEADSWKGDEGSAILQDPDLERFYRRVARDWAARSLLRLYFLEGPEGRVAFQLCARDSDRLASLKIGFRRDLARWGPGQALQLMILRELFADPDVSRFDLLGPATRHKLKWGTGMDQLWTVRCYRPGLRGGVAAMRWSVLPAVRSWASRVRAPSSEGELGS